ncbi:CoA transferase [Rhodococcus sp. IEGM 1366]|uniref:CaiB/BaiF CoA transferase family protein n=1 Tax=Rhodococcus sp. IEGM 1366 TaxID=3082223 RepID=UPI0029547E27|nr:CoA transferase [Rhodococcus sp. IEGM 1366]MDV8070925.1 CoA transferase [Rhodococcus sp. IEGM 1366]
MTLTNQPLDGIRVLEFGGYIAGPYATSILGSLGADVVKVEKSTGDDFRRGMGNASPYFVQYNAGKRSMAVDLKSSAGVDVVKSLLPHYDVLVENLRPGKMSALGLGNDECRAINNSLIYVSVTGFGNTGPLRDRPAYDTIGQAFGGLYSLLSPADNTGLSGTILADLVTGMSTAMGVLAAVVGRSRNGGSSYVETSILEAVSTLTIDALTQGFSTGEDPTLASRHPQAQNFCLRTSTGDDIAVHLSNSDTFWTRLCQAIDRPGLLVDTRYREYRAREQNYAELKIELEKVFVSQGSDYWEKRLISYDVPFAPVLGMSGYATHPQVDELQVIAYSEDGTVPLVRPPWRFDSVRPERHHSAPRVGEHTVDVVRDILDDDRIRALFESGVLIAHENASQPC